MVEVVVAMAAFSIIIMATVQIMAQGSKTYRGMKGIQTNLETAHFALNLMAKELRTSSVVSSDATSITFFDYSQSRCIRYSVSGGTLSRAALAYTATDPNEGRSDCASSGAGLSTALVTGITGQAFVADPSTPMPTPHVGRMTIALTVGTGGAAATVQTTVSLRDFSYIDI